MEGPASERSDAEPAGPDGDEWLRLAQVAGGVGLFDWRLGVRTARCSDFLFEVIGRPSPPGQRVPLHEAVAWIHPDDRSRVLAEITAGLAGAADHMTAELRVVRADGQPRWISCRGEIRRDAQGRATRVLGALQDVTDRKHRDDEVQEAQTRLSLARSAGRAGLWDWQITQGDTTLVSPEYRDLYGLTPDEPFSYARWLDRVYPLDRERVEAYGREVFAHGSAYSCEFRTVHPTRGLRWLGSVGLLVRDGEGRPVRFSGINFDITPLKEAEQARRQSDERFRKIFANAATGIAITDIHGRFEQCNPAYTTLLGYSEEELRLREFASLIHPDDRAANVAQVVRLIAGDVDSFEIENRAIRRDGEVRWVRKFVSVLTDEAGQPAHLMALVTDTTERRRAEDALRDADRRKDEFLATLAHELRNPLAPLRTGFEVLRRSPDRATREHARELMERQLEHMVRLVDDLLDVSRISRGVVELVRGPVALQTVIVHALDTVAPQISARRLTLTTELPPAPVMVEGDLTRLAQVVGNLLNNAAKFTPPDGHIGLTVRAEGGEAVIQVRDDGQGMAAELLPRVFDLFSQASRAGGRTHGGLGIGLYLVRRLVELHGGSITAASPGPGQGSVFTARLPMLPAVPTVVDPAAAHRPLVAGRRILVVDDNEDAAALLATILELHGHATLTAHDGPSALAAARAFTPEVAFLDLGLPGMSGHELARELRRRPGLERIALIALTGWGSEEDKRRSAEAGFAHHLTKPVAIATIEATLARC